MSAQTHSDKTGNTYVLGTMPDGKLAKFATFEDYEAAYFSAWVAIAMKEY